MSYGYRDDNTIIDVSCQMCLMVIEMIHTIIDVSCQMCITIITLIYLFILLNSYMKYTGTRIFTKNTVIETIPNLVKQCTNTVKHATHKTNRSINRATHTIQGYNITLTTTQVQEAIKQCNNNNSQGSEKLNIGHLKHIGPLGLAFLTSMLKTDLNTNIIPHIWKLANIVPITHKKRHRQGHLVQAHIPPLNNCQDTGEEHSSLHNSKHTKHTHTTWVHGASLYSDGTTHSKQHPSKGVQPNGSPCTNTHCSTRYVQRFRHNKHAHTYQKAATDPDTRHNH